MKMISQSVTFKNTEFKIIRAMVAPNQIINQ